MLISVVICFTMTKFVTLILRINKKIHTPQTYIIKAVKFHVLGIKWLHTILLFHFCFVIFISWCNAQLNYLIRCVLFQWGPATFQSSSLTFSLRHRCSWGAVKPAGSRPPPCPRRAGGGRWCTACLCSAGAAAAGAQHPPHWRSWCDQRTPSAPNQSPSAAELVPAEVASNHFLASLIRSRLPPLCALSCALFDWR